MKEAFPEEKWTLGKVKKIHSKGLLKLRQLAVRNPNEFDVYLSHLEPRPPIYIPPEVRRKLQSHFEAEELVAQEN